MQHTLRSAGQVEVVTCDDIVMASCVNAVVVHMPHHQVNGPQWTGASNDVETKGKSAWHEGSQ
jgi:hypothetical protein